MKKLLLFLLICPSLVAAQSLQWAGLSYITKDAEVSEKYPHSSKIEQSLRKILYKELSLLTNLGYELNLEGSDSSRDGTLSFLLAIDTERISSGKLIVDNVIKCLSIYSLSLQAIIYDQASQSILQIIPFAGESNHLDPLIGDDCNNRNQDLDTLRILLFYLSLDKTNAEQLDLLKIPFAERVNFLVKESNETNSLKIPNNVIGEFISSQKKLDLQAIRNTNFYVGISDVNLSELAQNQLSGNTELSENRYFSDFFGFQKDAFNVWVGQQFTKWFNEAFDMPLIPFVKGRALGKSIAIKFADSTQILNLQLPSLDFGFKINIRGFKKVMLDQSQLRQAFAWAAFSSVGFENVGIKEYTSIDIKNILTEEVNKGDDIDNWKRFNLSLNKSMRDYIQNLKTPNKTWVKENTNLKQKDFKKHTNLIKDKLGLQND